MAERILIVEDSMIVSFHIRGVLENAGYTIIDAVASGEEAVTIADRERPDLILMDIMLAGIMNGIEASHTIQQHARVPVIFLTAFSDKKTVEKAKLTAPYGIVTKPFDERDLLMRVEIALYKNKLEKENLRERLSLLIEGQESERARVSRELHDGMGQLLNAIKIHIEALDNTNYQQVSAKISSLINEAVVETRRISENLVPARLLDFDLVTCMGVLCKQANTDKIEIIFQTQEFTRSVTDQQKLGLYRIAQESIHNAVRHALCKKIYVQLYHDDSFIHLSIEDDGQGFDRTNRGGHGLRNIGYRVDILGGKVHIESSEKMGTLISVSIPLGEERI